jgi:hypothetical protein
MTDSRKTLPFALLALAVLVVAFAPTAAGAASSLGLALAAMLLWPAPERRLERVRARYVPTRSELRQFRRR